VAIRRGSGGDWQMKTGRIRIGRQELGNPERLWAVLAHELAHAQATTREGHSNTFWRRLACGLSRAGKLELLRHDIGYREGALKIARAYGLTALPEIIPFSFSIGQQVVTEDNRSWRITRRFRRSGQPVYRLRTRGWVWTVSESRLKDGISVRA